MDSIFDLLDELEDILDSASGKMFSTKISVNKDEIFDIIGEIRLNLPGEIKQAQRIADNCDKIINDANNKAKDIIRDAEERCERLISDHEITKKAKEESVLIIDEAKATSKEMRLGAIEYADEKLARVEQAIKETLEEFMKMSRNTEDFLSKEANIIYDNRQELRGPNRQ